MTFKRPLPVSLIQSKTAPTEKEDHRKHLCQVCGDRAYTVNYGTLTCASCRTFFRQHGFRLKDIPQCSIAGSCEITKESRRICGRCRFTKCLAVGMSPDLIRKEDLSKTNRLSLKSKSEQMGVGKTSTTIPQASALDLPPGGSRSHLSSLEWTMISNVVHAFDTFNPATRIRRTIETINTSASSLQFDLTQTYHMLSSFSNCLHLFISSTPDFKILTTSEQWSLLQRNMFGLLSIGGMYLMRECGVFDKPENEMAVIPLYGNEVVQQAKQISTQLDCDPKVIKLMLIALAFSSNCFTKDNPDNFDKDSLLLGTFRLFGSQNVYVELLWKYLNHRYSYDESVQRFSKLIKRLLDTLKLSVEIYETNQTYQAFIDDIIQRAEQSTMLNEKLIIPLSGKN